ncbi:MAG: hypothetical protein ACJAZ3_000932 [Sphingobacteriales bacterium]
MNTSAAINIDSLEELPYFIYYSSKYSSEDTIARVFKSIIYKNLYENIDLKINVNPKKGISTEFILKTGAKPTQIKARTIGEFATKKRSNGAIFLDFNLKNIIISEANLIPSLTRSLLGEPALKEEVVNQKQQNLKLNWVVNSYRVDMSRTMLKSDEEGNIFVLGGELPLRIAKYNIKGELLWIFQSPWVLPKRWSGQIAVNKEGEVCVTRAYNSNKILIIDSIGKEIYYSDTVDTKDTTRYFVNPKFTEFLEIRIPARDSLPDAFKRLNINSLGALGEFIKSTKGTGIYVAPALRSDGYENWLRVFLIHEESAIVDNFGAVVLGRPREYAISSNYCFFYDYDGITISTHNINNGIVDTMYSVSKGVLNPTCALVADDYGFIYASVRNGISKYTYDFEKTWFIDLKEPVEEMVIVDENRMCVYSNGKLKLLKAPNFEKNSKPKFRKYVHKFNRK